MITTRFAPSPTGNLHLGHAYAALFAQMHGERCLLRMEDIDHTRCKPEFEQQILEDLDWLGVQYTGGNRNAGYMKQSRRMGAYEAALAKLKSMDLVYPCYCSRQDIKRELAALTSAPHLSPSGPEGDLYPGTCRDRKTEKASCGEPAWRINAEKAAQYVAGQSWHDQKSGHFWCDPAVLGDFIVSRRGIGTSYHLAVVVDDAAQGVTLVTRGADLLAVTHAHRMLQILLGLPQTAWLHHPLLLDRDGVRLAKRHRSQTLIALREQGVRARDIRHDFKRWAG